MARFPRLLQCPGVYHPIFLSEPHAPAQARWFDETCALVEELVEALEPDRDPIGLHGISLAVHLLADHLFDQLGERAAWDQLRPAAFVAALDSFADAIVKPPIISICAAAYALLTDTQRIERRRGDRLSRELEAAAEAWRQVRKND